jgi:hypothetical protein
MTSILPCFFAFPSEPAIVGESIEQAITNLRDRSGITVVHSWRETDIAGRFIADQVLQKISDQTALIADVTQLNFNVAYEIGFALAKEKRVVLTRHKGITPHRPLVADVGIFDAIGYLEYENAAELESHIRRITDPSPSARNVYPLNQNAPVYLIEARFRTDSVTRIISRVKKARLFYRSFDPQESPRLSAGEGFEQVAQSFGVLLHLLPHQISDAMIHNLRVAFLGGLAEGFGKVLLILQDGEEPIPLDCRDLVDVFMEPSHIDEAISDFATRVTEAMQQTRYQEVDKVQSSLEKLTFGSSAAENEFRELSGYYLETDQFQRALRGEVRLVVGRKGSGKTAIFAQVRDRTREDRQNIVVDLRPDGYQLLKFKEMVLKYLGPGSLEHTVTAFWEYLLLLEICYKLLEKDRLPHTRDSRLLLPYRKLAAIYDSDRYVTEGDFSERLSRLLLHLTDDYRAKYGEDNNRTLSQQEITELLYRHDVNKLREQIVEYLKVKKALFLLFDNLDKGWPTHGLTSTDIAILRALLEATRKIERQLQRRDIDCTTLAFLRNDVYELLVSETPDRGKEGRVALDWSDPDLLRELIRRRMLYNDMPDRPFEDLWRTICVSHINGEETSQYLIDRCLMRPRALIDLVNHCRGFAVNLSHSRIEIEDVTKGVKAFSSDLVVDIGYEIRDVLPEAENVLYAFIDEPQTMPANELNALLVRGGLDNAKIPDIILILLWYGVLGVRQMDGAVTYIYNVNYEMPILKGIIRKLQEQGLVYVVNPAFVPGLQIREDPSAP